MTHVSDQAIGSILDNYADVIEGGTTWRGSGTSHKGIPGTRSNDKDLRSAADTPLTAEAGGSTTTLIVASSRSWDTSRWVKQDTPAYFAVYRTGTAANQYAARRITNWNNTTKTFTVDAFPASIAEADTFAIRQGFKRVPNTVDILGQAKDGFDRFFDLRTPSAGQMLPWWGGGNRTFETTIELHLRMLKFGRAHDAERSAFENLAIIRSIITKAANPDHRDGTYTQLLNPLGESGEKVVDDASKVVVKDTYRLRYRINAAFQ